MGDYHNHLHPHGPWDGRGPAPGDYPLSHIEAYVEAAASRGWSEVGFTEHLFRCEESAPVLRARPSRQPWRRDQGRQPVVTAADGHAQRPAEAVPEGAQSHAAARSSQAVDVDGE